MATTTQPAPASPTPDGGSGTTETFRVRYYDAKLSKKGRGVQVRTFADRAEAEAFAASNRIYSGPCRVEVSL